MMSRASRITLALSIGLLMAGSPVPGATDAVNTGWTIVGWNNLGMHCMDADFGVFSILPPYNTIHAQLMDPSGVLITNPAARGITVTYQGVLDPANSINTTSAGKTNWWDHVKEFFGVDLPVDMGLAGNAMPGPSNAPQPMQFDSTSGWFIALGIPITPIDDTHNRNAYPLMHLVAKDPAGNVLATTDIVLPVSDEMDCRACHASGSAPAARPAQGWVWNADSQRDYRLNILLLHDDLEAANPNYAASLAGAGFNPGGLYPTATAGRTSILCAKCHPSEALGGGGQPAYVQPLTADIHAFHAAVTDPTNGLVLNSSSNRSACYRCHPGSTTKCLRGAMGTAVASNGSLAMQCQSCHGSMSDVGAPATTRTGWLDEPNCQSCHTGTAMANSGQIRYTNAFVSPGVPRLPADATFATNQNVPLQGKSLYRFSFGHGSLACEACHGSTHAEYPSSHPNDNLQSQNLQGHSGMLVECDVCHTSPGMTAIGPHGMHPVGQQWVIDHHDVASPDPAPCRACHGPDYRGTVLSMSQADRTFSTPFGTKHFWNGFMVGCYTCHIRPTESDPNPNRAPVAGSATATTTAGASLSIGLVATDPDNNPLTLRIVNQPTHGTAALAGTVAVYFPEADYVGGDSFTFAANDGSTDSNLATVAITVGVSPCSLTCGGTVPGSVAVNSAAFFQGSATANGCGALPSYEWDFGDGTLHSTSQSPSHAYVSADTFRWTMTTRAGVASCTSSGTIRTTTSPLPVPSLLQALEIGTSNHGRDLAIRWDPNNCPSSGYHLLYGYGSGLASGTIAGGVCALGTFGSALWAATPDPSGDPRRLLWFLVAGDDASSTEGSWGTTSAGQERGGTAASGVCGFAVKNTAGYCAAP
jgi:hypothetical protein